MSNMEREIVRTVLATLGIVFPDHEKFVASLAEIVRERAGQPLLPKPGESLALSVMRPKTAALAFDRVWRLPGATDPMPEELGFYCATVPEIAGWAYVLLGSCASNAGIDVPDFSAKPAIDIAANETDSLRLLCSEFGTTLGTTPTIFYEHSVRQRHDFPDGPCEILVAAISDCIVVDENALNWDQVLEFRRDADARAKYRRLVRWIDTELKTRSPGEIEDLLAIRLDDYQWAIKKHGLKALMGSLSCLLDPKFLGGVSAAVAATAVAGGAGWAALAGASLSVGRALLSFGTAYVDGVDERRKENYEIAYLYEVQRL
jgi:hypothetical protein